MSTSINENECPLCYEHICDNDSITTRCNHTFCRSCLDTWNKPSCPMCRQEYLIKYA